MAELKPCPFCGSLASVHTEGTGYHVRCNYERNCVTIGPWKKTEAEAIEAWNRRTPSRDSEAMLNALVMDIGKFLDDVPFSEYGDALVEGCDSNGAWDCFVEAMSGWIDEIRERLAILKGTDDE